MMRMNCEVLVELKARVQGLGPVALTGIGDLRLCALPTNKA